MTRWPTDSAAAFLGMLLVLTSALSAQLPRQSAINAPRRHLTVEFFNPDVPSGRYEDANRFTRKLEAAITLNSADAVLATSGLGNARWRVSAQECAQPNAYYSTARRRIIYCYGMNDFPFALVKDWGGVPDSSRADVALNFQLFAVLHEVGHALIRERSLPVLGNNEDAADGFAAWLLLRQTTIAGGPSVLLGASWWLLALQEKMSESSDYRNDMRDYAKTHPFPGQRHARLECFYGGATGRMIDTQRDMLDRCIDEWRRLDESWSRLLH